MNYFNPEIQLKDTKSALKNKLIDLLSELRDFKFVTILVLELKKIKNDDKTIYTNFYLHSKAEAVINEMTLMMYLSQSILLLYQTCKNL